MTASRPEKGSVPSSQVSSADQQKGNPQNDNHLHAVAHISFFCILRFKKESQQPARQRAACNAKQDGYGNTGKIHGGYGAALGHAREGGKQDDNKYVIQGSPGQNQLGNPLIGAVAGFHQLHHFRHDHGRGNGAQHCAQDGGFQ